MKEKSNWQAIEISHNADCWRCKKRHDEQAELMQKHVVVVLGPANCTECGYEFTALAIDDPEESEE